MASIDIDGGIPINKDIKLKNLSGPISIKIVVPQAQFLKDYPRAPIFILLGDEHFNDENLCDETVPDICRVNSIEFLELLCTLLKSNETDDITTYEKIDFYIEGGDMHRKKKMLNPNIKQPMVSLWDLMIKCNNSMDYPSLNYDKIRNIRWQSGDIRSWGLKPYPIQKKIDEQKEFYNKQTFKMQSTQPQYYSIFNFLNKLLENKKVSKFDKFSDEDYFRIMFKSLVVSVKEQNLYFDRTTLKTTLDDLSAKYIDDETSLINFELMQIKSDDKKTFILNKCKEYINYTLDTFSGKYKIDKSLLFDNITNIHKEITDLCSDDNISNSNSKDLRFESIYKKKSHAEMLFQFLLETEAMSSDLYTFVRSFKRMIIENPYNSYSIINICYFGDLHISHMFHFLTKILGLNNYKSILNINSIKIVGTNKVNRCLDLKDVKIPSLTQLLNLIRIKRYAR